MPLYEYDCSSCDTHWSTHNVPVSKRDDSFCPVCQCSGRRRIAAPAFKLKGAGFHTNDYGKNGPR